MPDPDTTGAWGRRFGAFVIDVLLSAVVTLAAGAVLADHTDFDGALRHHDCHVKLTDAGDEVVSCAAPVFHDGVTARDGAYTIVDPLPLVLVVLVAGLGAFVVLPALTGGSPGKLATGVRVVSAAGARATPGQHLLRWVLLAVDGPLTFGVCGLLTSLIREDGRRLGDMVAGTYVVRKELVTA